jgi:hypothetical protein
MQYVGLNKFADPTRVPTIPASSLAKYQATQPQKIDAAPRTEVARRSEVPMIAGAAQSERAEHAAWGWTSDPALLVGVAVCFAVWLASTKILTKLKA